MTTFFWHALRVFVRRPGAVAYALVPPILLAWLLRNSYGTWLPGRSEQILAITGGAPEFTDAWIVATVAALSAFTAATAVFLGVVRDRADDRFGLYIATTGRRWAYIGGYLVAAVKVAFLVPLVVVGAGQVWAMYTGAPVMSLALWVRAIGGLALNAIFYAGLTAAAASLITRPSGLGAYGVVGGVVAGFLSLSFILPQGGWLPEIAGLMPFAEGAALVRYPVLAPVIGSLGLPSGAAPGGVDALNCLVGARIEVLGSDPWPTLATVLFLATWSLAVLAIGLRRMVLVMRTT